MQKILFIFLFLLLLISCQNEKQNSIIKENMTKAKEYIPNDELREKILPKFIDKCKPKFERLLDSLDQKKISFCNFVKREDEIDDSCYAEALEVYPNPEDQKEFLQLHNDIYDRKQRKYLKEIGITEKEADLLITIAVFDKNVKNFCDKY